jgi:hypothetical protein
MSSMRVPRALAASIVVVGLTTASCGGGSTSSVDSEPSLTAPDTSAPATSEEAEAAAVAEEFLASFDPDDVDTALAMARDLDRQAELTLAELEGITDELGGPEAAATAFAEADAAFAPLTESLETPIVFGIRRPQQAEPDIGGGLFGGFMTVALGAKDMVAATNDGSTGTRSLADGVTVTATPNSVRLAVDVTHRGDGLTTTLKTDVEIQPCPDANGQFVVDAKIDTTSTVTGGSKSQRGTLQIEVTGQLDDDARLVSSTTEVDMKRTGLEWGSFVETSSTITADSVTTRVADFNWFTTTPEQVADNARLGVLFGMMVKQFVIDAALAGIESGRCVEIAYGVSPGTSGLDPSSTATITATPRAKLDQAPTGGTVTASLASGRQSVEPSLTPIPVPADFTYTASDQLDDTGTVALEARSRRGVGKLEIKFTTGARYVVTGDSGGVTFSGTVESLSAPFSIDISFPGSESGAFAFDASTPNGGGVAINAEGSGATLTGSGTYTVADNDDGNKTVTASVSTCVDVSGVCNSTVHTILLTRAT